MSPRTIALVGLLLAGLALAAALYVAEADTPLESTLVPAFELLGTPAKALDQLAGQLLPVDEIDERDLGLVLRQRYEARVNRYDRDFLYLNELLAEVTGDADRPFEYRAYVLDDYTPNAMALPGGTILVTRGMIRALRSEAELVAVLAHELGHVERGHCFDAVKLELLARKLGHETLGKIADVSYGILLRHSFSKTQEADADEYAYGVLVHGPYDPRGVGQAFESLLAQHKSSARPRRNRADPLRDYFLSHPPLELRRARYLERAERWWIRNKGERRYVGRANLQSKRSFAAGTRSPSEWVRS